MSAQKDRLIQAAALLDMEPDALTTLLDSDTSLGGVCGTPPYPEGTHREDMHPRDALVESLDLWGSGVWQDDNAVDNLAEVMGYLSRLIDAPGTSDTWGWQGTPDDPETGEARDQGPAPEGFSVFAHWSVAHAGVNVQIDAPDGLPLTVYVNDWRAVNVVVGGDDPADDDACNVPESVHAP